MVITLMKVQGKVTNEVQGLCDRANKNAAYSCLHLDAFRRVSPAISVIVHGSLSNDNAHD